MIYREFTHPRPLPARREGSVFQLNCILELLPIDCYENLPLPTRREGAGVGSFDNPQIFKSSN